MVSTKSLTVNKHIIMPIVVFMYVFALVRLVELINEVIVGYDNRILFILHLISTALWIFAGDILLVLHLRRLRKAFYITAVVSAGLLTILDFLILFSIPEIPAVTRVLQGLSAFPLVLFLFLIFYFKNEILNLESSGKDIFPILALIVFLIGLASILNSLLVGGLTFIQALLTGLIFIIIGFGLAAREKAMGLYGAVIWIVMNVIGMREPVQDYPGNKFLFVIQNLAFPAALIVILFIFRRTGFETNLLSGTGNMYSGRKTCSKCGKTVTMSARAGEHCPYCGAYWVSEKQIKK